MFGKLWEWIMGIIAWIMSKFSRKTTEGEQASDVTPSEPVVEAVQESPTVASSE